jgi:hypothetical protein
MISLEGFVMLHYRNIRSSLIFVLLLTLFNVPNADAAYCSLRDPVAAIQQLYPESNRYRSLVRLIDQEIRTEISREMPFSLHFNELGKHTLFLALADEKPVGFVHARSEISDTGMIEVAWAISLDMTIQGFYFQRCRSPRCNTDLTKKILGQLQGKSFHEILSLLSQDGLKLNELDSSDFAEDKALVLSVIRSALKTLKVTELAWETDIARIQRNRISLDLLKSNENVVIKKIVHAGESTQENNESMISTDSIEVHLVLQDGKEVGRLVEADWKQGEYAGEFLWLFSPQGHVIDIQPKQKWQSSEVASSFSDVIGQQFSKNMSCSSATEIAGKELFTAGFPAP